MEGSGKVREIKFRGMTEKGTWYLGDLVKNKQEYDRNSSGFFIMPYWQTLNAPIRVIEETVGQYTGLKDKNGVEIYEFDIVESKHGQIGVIKFKNYGFCVDFEKEGYDSYLIHVSQGKVVGNIHENKELLGE